jgi:endonuclease/exonuclease/phosphatase family metal-dependent hydrolase
MSQPALSVLTLNVEGQKHLAKVTQLLERLQPEVICLQEVFAVDLPQLAATVSGEFFFVPTVNINKPNNFGFAPVGENGVAIITRLPHGECEARQYHGTALPEVNDQDSNTPNRVVLWLDVALPETNDWVRIATTHFTWSPGGEVIPLQTQTIEKLLEIYSKEIKTGLLCGDFNAPRGNSIYQRLTQQLTDNIPATVKTTLDPDLHRAGQLDLVVDYFFTTPGYRVDSVECINGVSDHLAVFGQLRIQS